MFYNFYAVMNSEGEPDGLLMALSDNTDYSWGKKFEQMRNIRDFKQFKLNGFLWITESLSIENPFSLEEIKDYAGVSLLQLTESEAEVFFKDNKPEVN